MTQSGDNNSTQGTQGFHNYLPNVAYTLGDLQPVRSTYIAHDPFFFMDIDENLLEEELLAELDREYGSFDFQSEEEEYDRLLTYLERFDENAVDLQGGMKAACDIREVRDILSRSRYMASLLEFAEDNSISFRAAPYIFSVEYNRAENTILFQPQLSKPDLLKGLIYALRQAWQNYQGALLQPLALYPDHAVFINRAQKADLAVSLLRASWELNLAGAPEAWDSLELSGLRDLTHTYGREAASDFRSLNNGRASFLAFETWFLSDRSRHSDTCLIQKMLSDYSGMMFDNEDMSQLIVIDLVKALGEMPFGKNYLAQQIPNLISDPIFTEVRDRSSANFLWFIKFEKTFSQMERDLQKENLSSSATFATHVEGALSETFFTNGDDFDDQALPQTGILIPFPVSRRKLAESGSVSGKSGEVIPFDITIRPFNGGFL